MISKEDINSTYSRIRQLDSTIPDIVLEFMRHSSIDALNAAPYEFAECGNKEVWQFEEGCIKDSEQSLKDYISTLEHHKEILTSAIEKVVCDIWEGESPTVESELLKNALIKVYRKVS